MHINLKNIKETLNIGSKFYDLDEETKTATASFVFEKASDLFDSSFNAKIPVLSDSFIESIKYTFEAVPEDYGIYFEILCKDTEDHTVQELEEIFKNNIELEATRLLRKIKKKSSLAAALIITGLIFFVAMLHIEHVWAGDALPKKIFAYITDIATTVTFWEALTIILVDMKEQFRYNKDLKKRFKSITFKG
ncbi:MAG: hypothetical protein K6F82_05875 [Sphaerochaetaceae bacterium]|nr:hypothetical protein [Sphaerochaetaceae bacterium]